MASRFSKLMIAYDLPRSRVARRLDEAEFRVFITALCLAGREPARGALLLAKGEALTAADIADEARVGEAVVEETLDKLVRFGTLVPDDRQKCLRFANWDAYNPAPRPSDSAEATRERKRRQRAREKQGKQRTKDAREPRLGHKGSAIREVDETEGASAPQSGGELTLPSPPASKRKRDQGRYEAALTTFCDAHFPGAPPAAVAQHGWTLRKQGVEPTVEALSERLDLKQAATG